MDSDLKKILSDELSKRSQLVVDSVDTVVETGKKELHETSEKAKILAERARDINNMRKRWSNWLLGCIVGIVGFDLLFILLFGFGKLKFGDEKLVFAFIVENLVKIAGLAYIVVKFLFDKDLDKDS